MNNTMNYYELLGIKNNATEEEIKLAYKKQMKKWHPDINKSEEAVGMSAKINEAKEILLDEIKRRDYDEYLTKKTEESYNRYTQRKTYENTNTYTNTYQEVKITKWEYLNDWLKHSIYSKPRKIFGTIGVLLESLLCYIIKLILIAFSFICNFLSYFIQVAFGYIYPIIGILFVLFIVLCMTNGFINTVNENPDIFKALIIIALVFISSFILPVISKLVISPKVFDILYNKIDINLFKKCVGYKD